MGITEKDILKAVATDIPNVKTNITNKVDKIQGKGLSTNDYTNLDKAEVEKVKDKANKTYVDTNILETNQSIDDIKANGIIPTTENAMLGSATNPFKGLLLGECDKSDIGYTTLPNGLTLQWGFIDVNLTTVTENYSTITFPIAFTNKCLVVIPVNNNANPTAYNILTNATHISNSQGRVYASCVKGTSSISVNCKWIAIGY